MRLLFVSGDNNEHQTPLEVKTAKELFEAVDNNRGKSVYISIGITEDDRGMKEYHYKKLI